jgi:multiple antibiotic resistance protein
MTTFFTQISFAQISSAFIILFAIIDIIGAIPLILNIKSKNIDINPRKTTCIALLLMILFLFSGELILNMFHVDIQSFAVAGALVLFIMALEMILDIEIFKNKGPKNVISIVPIAFPLIAGPGSFTALISLRAEFYMINILIALIINLLFVLVVLKMTGTIEKILGKGGIYILRKFFGIILLAIAVKLFATNLHSLI